MWPSQTISEEEEGRKGTEDSREYFKGRGRSDTMPMVQAKSLENFVLGGSCENGSLENDGDGGVVCN